MSCECGASGAEELGNVTFFDSIKDRNNHEAEPTECSDKQGHWSEYLCCNTLAEYFEAHNWDNGICTECKHVCSHEGGELTCQSLPVCDYCELEYGEPDPNAHVYERGEVIKEPSCTRVGTLQLFCIYCENEATEDIEELGHEYRDWSEYEAATCLNEGTGIRSCERCRDIETVVIPKVGHNFSALIEDTDADGNDTLTVVCSVCETMAGGTYQGIYLEDQNSFFLTDCPQDFFFDVYVDMDEYLDYILFHLNESLVITELHHSDMNTYDHPEVKINFSITPIGGNTYRITPLTPLEENKTYIAKLGGGSIFTDKLGDSLIFKIAGEEKVEIEYNSDILFLKDIADRKNVSFEYSIEYIEDEELYALVISKDFALDDSLIGKLLCVGNCVSMAEADALPSDEVVIGRIERIYTEYEGILVVALSVPSVEDIYSKLDVSGSTLPRLDDSAITDEMKQSVLNAVIQSDDFATALAASKIAASNFALERGYTAEGKLDLSIDQFKIEAKVISTDSETVKIEFTIYFDYKSDIMDGNINLGTITFNLEFYISYAINIDVTSNLDKLFTAEMRKNGLNLDCTVTNTFSARYDMSFDLKMNYLFEGEAIYVINTATKKVHLPSCRFCPTKADNIIFSTRRDLIFHLDNYESHACGFCNPFTMGKGGFIISPNTQTIHCVECAYVDNELLNSETVHKFYPIGLGGKDCSVCKPQTYTKTLEKYLEESVSDANFDEMFGYIRDMISDKAEGKGESPIDADTKPKITIPLYCFEIPIYLEPKMDFALKANFKMHYELEIKNVICVALVRTEDGYRVIGSSKAGKPAQSLVVDMTGEFKVELGVISEIRLGVRYLSKQVYIGVLGEAGMYVDTHGIYHLDTEKDEHYYAAMFEIGYYTEVRCTYKVVGIIRADSFDILEKKYSPIFNSGDEKIYNRFTSYEDEMSFDNTKLYFLDNLLLGVNYYDLKARENKSGYLSWGEKKQYGFDCVFKDENGNTVDYIIFEGGALKVLDGAPEEFTVYMTVTVYDKIIAQSFEEYVGKDNKGGCAIFLEPKVIKITYKYVDTTAELEKLKGVYEGYYDIGTNLFGEREYRYKLIGIHKISELIEDEELLSYYAKLASFVKVDENGNPETLYTLEDAREMLLALPYEYVMIEYSEPGNGTFDMLVTMSATGVYYSGGLVTNASNDYYVENTDSSPLFTVVEFVEGEGIYGKMYSDSTMEEPLGDFRADLIDPSELYSR